MIQFSQSHISEIYTQANENVPEFRHYIPQSPNSLYLQYERYWNGYWKCYYLLLTQDIRAVANTTDETSSEMECFA